MKLKNLFLYLLFLLPFVQMPAQQIGIGNGWYISDPNRPFVKLLVDRDGIYRVSSADLQSAGHDLTAVNPDFLQLLYRGQEVPIFLKKSGSGQLSYFEFFGKRNNGSIDSLMYRDPVSGVLKGGVQPDVDFSMFSDTSAYFLTWAGNLGRRYISFTDILYSAYSPESYFTYRAKLEYAPEATGSVYSLGGGGAFDTNYTLNTDYVPGEGYVGKAFSSNSSLLVDVQTPVPAVPAEADVSFRIFGRSNTQHRLRVTINNESVPLMDTTWNLNSIYIKTYHRSYSSNLSGNTTSLRFAGLSQPTDNNNLCFAAITYNRQFNLNGKGFVRMRDWEKNVPAYFRFENADGNDSVYVFDLTNGVRADGLITGASGAKVANVVVPGLAGKRQLFVVTDKSIRKPVIKAAHSLANLHNPSEGAEFVIITHPSLQSSATAYKAYRENNSPNPLSVRIVYTDQIYDEYGYGSVTPWAIKRFCKDALDNWQVKPQYFFLWGKGAYRTRNRAFNLVPTFGYPASDYEYVGHYDQSSIDIKTKAAIGRVNVLNDEDGLDYLEKVNEYEHSEWEPWMKKAVFLGGGGTANEQLAIEDFYGYIINLFTSPPIGGEVHYFQKTSSSVVIDPATADYHSSINEGVSVIDFFGHSTNNIQDISLKEPYEYENNHRYLFLIAKGCYGGDFTAPGRSFGERWIKERQKGAIGYLANSSSGYLSPLRDYGQILAGLMYDRRLGEPIGMILKEHLQIYSDSLVGIQYRNHGRQMNLQGDPAIILYHPEKPDLEVNETSVYFDPDNFTALDDSFGINVIVNNLGLAVEDSFVLSIRQRVPSGDIYQHPLRTYPAVVLRDTFFMKLANPYGNAITGPNNFEIFVDADDRLDEYSETNNLVNFNRTVPGNIPAILFPSEFAITGDATTYLAASAFFMTNQQDVGYIFEIDSVSTFNSPGKATSGVIRGNATYISWDIPFTLLDSTVYYWRVRLSDVTPSVWAESSFKYILNRTGWAQADLPQFEKDKKTFVNLDLLYKDWEFTTIGVSFLFNVKRSGHFEFFQNGTLRGTLSSEVLGGDLNGIGYTVIDQRTLQPKVSSIWSDYAGLVRPPQELFLLKNVIMNTAPGDYVILASNYNPKVPVWTEEFFDVLKQIGVSDNIRLLVDGDRFLILGRKGHPNSAVEILSPNSGNKEYQIEQILMANRDEGTIASTRIGPSLGWDKIFWDWYTKDDLEREDIDVDVFGIRADKSDTLLMTIAERGLYDISQHDAKLFPYMRLEANLKDSLYRTAPQLEHWHVLFETVPDAVVDPITNFAFKSDTIYEGEEVSISMGARNLTQIGMDSLKVKFYLQRQDRSRVDLDSIRLAPLPGDGRLDFSYSFNSRGLNLREEVQLYVEINPDEDQPEQYHFNNIYIQPFYVIVDEINPIMDVTFDGKHIMDGDIISPNPEILVQINDENEFVAVEDSGSFDIFFRQPGEIDFTPIFPGDPRLEWYPGQLPDNKAKLYFRPGFSTPLDDSGDDEYDLRVQGRDQRGNAAGTGDNYYEISFKVVNEATITQVVNYPNPFSTSTRFVYTLTGSELPELFQIHIYTLSGKMVKMIDLVELGDVFYGRNLTNYAWDGTDEYGDKLANGVYLYRVVTKTTGDELKLRTEGTETYFNNGWGKMYLMR